ncbi:TPA: SIMPL domain-containing protein [Candidatus Woesearchaeota archaeon]|nr:SIMPL domain-containing protein [Candidatus Woesearchaeota archaeon]
MEKKNECTYKKFHWILAIGFVILLAAAFKLGYYKSSYHDDYDAKYNRNIITVSGNSEIDTAPDKAEMYVAVTNEALAAKDAKDKNSETNNNIIDALIKQGLKKEDIETSSFTISPRYTWENDEKGNGKQVFKGYEVKHVLKVTTQTIDKVGEFLDAAVDAGANNVEQIRFGLTKEKEAEVKTEALYEAAKNAEEKAIVLATSLGVNLKKAVSIQETSFSYQPYYYDARSVEVSAMAKMESTPIVAPKSVEVKANVNVVFGMK